MFAQTAPGPKSALAKEKQKINKPGAHTNIGFAAPGGASYMRRKVWTVSNRNLTLSSGIRASKYNTVEPRYIEHGYIELLLISNHCQFFKRITCIFNFLYRTRSVKKWIYRTQRRPKARAPETGGRLSRNAGENSGGAAGVCDSNACLRHR